VTYRIHRSQRANDVILALSGDLDENHAVELQGLFAAEGKHHVVLDRSDVTLVDRDAVRFLSRIETEGAVLVNCPEYVRSWITAERSGI
jgi:anti-anti-sigma regulatory factor